ncbi:MAG: hypothetical protein JEY99_16855 [Spirochaetales bacterium]|nr:hypothetical protein [Spirochaetales bacterium]
MPKRKRNQKTNDRKRRFSYYTKQLLILAFFISIFLLFLFILGNFQDFHDSTQINLISWLRWVSIIYLWLAAIHLGFSILELILFRVIHPGFLILLFFSSAFIFAVRVVFTAAEKIIL